VSDNILRIIPTVPGWVPAEADIAAARRVAGGLCPDEVAARCTQRSGSSIRAALRVGAVPCLPGGVGRDVMGRTHAAGVRGSLHRPGDHDAVLRGYHIAQRPGLSLAGRVLAVRAGHPQPRPGLVHSDEMSALASALGHPVRQIFCHY
jgi:hypothetical protein